MHNGTGKDRSPSLLSTLSECNEESRKKGKTFRKREKENAEMRGLYGLEEVEQAVNELEKGGWEIVVVEGCMIDSYVCLAPDDRHWNYIFYEHYLNEWCSAYKVRRCSKISKRVERWIEKNEQDKERYYELT